MGAAGDDSSPIEFHVNFAITFLAAEIVSHSSR